MEIGSRLGESKSKEIPLDYWDKQLQKLWHQGQKVQALQKKLLKAWGAKKRNVKSVFFGKTLGVGENNVDTNEWQTLGFVEHHNEKVRNKQERWKQQGVKIWSEVQLPLESKVKKIR